MLYVTGLCAIVHCHYGYRSYLTIRTHIANTSGLLSDVIFHAFFFKREKFYLCCLLRHQLGMRGKNHDVFRGIVQYPQINVLYARFMFQRIAPLSRHQLEIWFSQIQFTGDALTEPVSGYLRALNRQLMPRPWNFQIQYSYQGWIQDLGLGGAWVGEGSGDRFKTEPW
jgi:hypothetical protein